MAALKKPIICDNCSGNEFTHLFKPERWVCSCGHAQAQRAVRNDPNKCRECDAERGSTPFKKGSNICASCQSKYHAQYREDNEEELRERHRDSYQRDKKKRIASVRKAVQRSPEAFIRHLMHHIQKQSNYKRRPDNRLGRNMKGSKIGGSNGLLLPVEIDFDYLWNLWETQGGLCALSRLPMVHEFNSLCSISVDRVDSAKGYVPGNVQLVCKWVNLAKQRHSNEEFLGLLAKLKVL